MPKISFRILAAIFSASVLAPTVSAAPEAEQDRAFADAEIVPAKGEYVVLISEKTAAKKDWRNAADKFVKRYAGKLVIWRGNDISETKEALKKARPRYVAVVAAPEEIDRVFVAKLHRLSREMNDDAYGDFLWGIVSGRDGKTAAGMLAKDTALILNRAIGTTNFDQSRFQKSFFITDWGAREFVETEKFVSSGKKPVVGDKDMTEIFAERWKKIDPQLVISSSHATEFNLEMPFGEGLLASAGTDFYLIPKKDFSAFARMMGAPEALKKFSKKQNTGTLPKTPSEKIWIAAGNCLFGDALRSENSMAITAISAANVKQCVGYTIPSWFGEGGWGTCDKFFNGHQATSVGQAWFFNNQILIDALPRKTDALQPTLSPDGMRGPEVMDLAKMLHNAGVNARTRETVGRFYDRDVVAFYGDPLYRARFNPNAPNTSPWNIRLKKSGEKKLICELKTTRKDGFKGDFCLWFPMRVDAETPPKIISNDGKSLKIEPRIFTENFVIFRNLELGGDTVLKLRFISKK